MRFKILFALYFCFFTALTALINISGSKAYAVLAGGNCYKNLGFGSIERITSSYPSTNGGCPTGFTPQSGKCYSYSESAPDPQEFECSSVKECMSTQGSGYQSTVFIPNGLDCEEYKIAIRGDSQIDANERADENGSANDTPADNTPVVNQNIAGDGDSDELHTANAQDKGLIYSFVLVILTVIGALAGVAIVGSFVVAGIQYATAGDNPSAVTKAKTRIAYTLIVMVVYAMLYYVAVWLIPS